MLYHNYYGVNIILLSCSSFKSFFVLSHSSCLLIIQLSVRGLVSGAFFTSIFNANILKSHIKPCHHSFFPKQWISGCNNWNRCYYLSSVLCIINLLFVRLLLLLLVFVLLSLLFFNIVTILFYHYCYLAVALLLFSPISTLLSL